MAEISVRCTRAFTLVEIIASVLLFSMGILSVIAVISHGLAVANRAQGDATAWATAQAVLRDPLPMGGNVDPGTGLLRGWTWQQSGSTWTATETGGGSDPVWRYTAWKIDQNSDVLVADIADPQANNPALFPPGGAPQAGCACGWLNGYYVERREQSRASDRIGQGVRVVEVRVDVYWAGYLGADGRPLASLVDRRIRQEAP